MQRVFKIVLDKLFALIALIILSPVMVIAGIGIKVSSKGPIIYKATRMGKNLKPFVIYKFRTMRVGSDIEGSITSINDNRIFLWGDVLRKLKIDELPQLLNVLQGTMSIIGPRPEDIEIVNNYYTAEEKKTLEVLPGLACPGSIFNYTHGEQYLSEGNTDDAYVSNLLHEKLALDMYYIENWSILYDIELVIRTIYVVLITTISKKQMPYPKEYLIINKGRKLEVHDDFS